MTTATRSRKSRKPAVKKDRHISLLALLDNGSGIFQVREGDKADKYFFAPLASDFGTAFTVEKWADAADDKPAGIVQTYHVCLSGKESTCECMGHLRHGHKTVCRHIAGLSALVEAGKLPTAPTSSKPAPCPHENTFEALDGSRCCADCGSDL